MNILLLVTLVLNCCWLLDSTPVYKPMENPNLHGGDMKLFNHQQKGMQKTLGIKNTTLLWPKGIIYYEFDPIFNAAQKRLMLDSMALIKAKTMNCIKFLPKTASSVNWLTIQSLEGCWSFVGRDVEYYGSQSISIQIDGCMYKGTIVHEFLHAAGFQHEQSRPDRDSYLNVNYKNIIPGEEPQFDKTTDAKTFGIPYDYYSIMHYGSFAFSKDGVSATMLPKRRGVVLKEPYEKNTYAQILTPSDAKAIRALYKC